MEASSLPPTLSSFLLFGVFWRRREWRKAINLRFVISHGSVNGLLWLDIGLLCKFPSRSSGGSACPPIAISYGWKNMVGRVGVLVCGCACACVRVLASFCMCVWVCACARQLLLFCMRRHGTPSVHCSAQDHAQKA